MEIQLLVTLTYSGKLIVIVKEMFYVYHLPTLMQSFPRISTSMVNFCTLENNHIMLIYYYRYCASMPNMFHVEVKEDNALDYDDFTNTMAEVHTNTYIHYC